MPKMYKCTHPKCKGKRHKCGKIYTDHWEYREKEDDKNKQYLMTKLRKLNRMISFGNYDEEGVKFLKELRRKFKEKNFDKYRS